MGRLHQLVWAMCGPYLIQPGLINALDPTVKQGIPVSTYTCSLMEISLWLVDIEAVTVYPPDGFV